MVVRKSIEGEFLVFIVITILMFNGHNNPLKLRKSKKDNNDKKLNWLLKSTSELMGLVEFKQLTVTELQIPHSIIE